MTPEDVAGASFCSTCGATNGDPTLSNHLFCGPPALFWKEPKVTKLEQVAEYFDANAALAADVDTLAFFADCAAAIREAMGARNVAYGLLWNCSVDTRTETGRCTYEARKALLATMTKDDQSEGIAAANAILNTNPEGA